MFAILSSDELANNGEGLVSRGLAFKGTEWEFIFSSGLECSFCECKSYEGLWLDILFEELLFDFVVVCEFLGQVLVQVPRCIQFLD